MSHSPILSPPCSEPSALPWSQPASIASSANNSIYSYSTVSVATSGAATSPVCSPPLSPAISPRTSPCSTSPGAAPPGQTSARSSLSESVSKSTSVRNRLSRIFSYHGPKSPTAVAGPESDPRDPSQTASRTGHTRNTSVASTGAASLTLSVTAVSMQDAGLLPPPAFGPPRTPIPKDLPRFVNDGNLVGGHEHHLRCCSRRHDRVYRKLKNLIGRRHEAPEDYDDFAQPEDKRLHWQPPPSPLPTSLAFPSPADPNAVSNQDVADPQHPVRPTLFTAITHTGTPNSLAVPLSPTLLLERAGSADRMVKGRPACSPNLEDKYGKCHEVVGRGAFGIVRVSHKKQEHGERLFAVKEFRRKPHETEKKFSKRLMSEYNIGVSLQHPNICRVLDLVTDGKGDLCEVMEFCAGGDLYSVVLAAGHLDLAEADCFFRQMISGVAYLHEMGVAHRDLKPENLLLTKRGSLKIADFGNGECFRHAWETEAHMVSGVCGSAPYIAPEEYTDKEFDARPVDIWACGVIYMAMLTGRHLWNVAKLTDEFYSRYLDARLTDVGYGPIETLPRTRCRKVIYSILEPCPTRRSTAAQVLGSDWIRDVSVCKAGQDG